MGSGLSRSKALGRLRLRAGGWGGVTSLGCDWAASCPQAVDNRLVLGAAVERLFEVLTGSTVFFEMT